jgi:hypothetical protein
MFCATEVESSRIPGENVYFYLYIKLADLLMCTADIWDFRRGLTKCKK